MESYELVTIADLLQVPLDKRDRCLDELRLCLELAELTFGDRASESMRSFTWTDDDSRDVTVIANGEELLKLEITPLPPKANEKD